jgi:predicted Ser/Thr protein kinase
MPNLSELLQSQQRAWQAGERRTVERLLEMYPILIGEDATVLDLIYGEMELRSGPLTDLGPLKDQVEEYCARFPHLAKRLRDGANFLGELAEQVEAAPSLPRKIDRYRIHRELANGGNGRVFLAEEEPPSRRPVVIKLYHTPLPSPDECRSFAKEAEALALLSRKEGFVTVYTHGVHAGRPYLVMEYLERGSLAAELGRQPGRRLAPVRAAEVVRKLAAAMHEAHTAGGHRIIHRDLKPDNVMLTATGEPKVADFGLARIASQPDGATQNRVVGTLKYMPPEQARCARADERSDIYGLGAILYELLTGRPPFPVAGCRAGRTPESVLDEVLDPDLAPQSPRVLNPAVPRDLEAICLKCLEKDPKNRFQSAQQLVDDLGRFEQGRPTITRPVGWTGQLRRWVRREPDRAGLSVAGVVVGLLVIAVALGFSLLRENKQRTRDAELYAQQAQRHASQVEDLTATGFVLPLSSDPGRPVSWEELRALWGVAALSSSQEAVRRKVLLRALLTEETARQVGSRPEELIQAIVGLDRERARKVREDLRQLLTDRETPEGIRLAAIRCVCALDLWDSDLAACTLHVLLDLLPGWRAEVELLLSQHGTRLVDNLDPESADTLSGRFLHEVGPLPVRERDSDALRLGDWLPLILRRLDEGRAVAWMGTLIQAIQQAKSWDAHSQLRHSLRVLAERVSDGNVQKLIADLLRAIDLAPDSSRRCALGDTIPVLASRLAPSEAVGLIRTLRGTIEQSQPLYFALQAGACAGTPWPVCVTCWATRTARDTRHWESDLLKIFGWSVTRLAERVPVEVTAELARLQLWAIGLSRYEEASSHCLADLVERVPDREVAELTETFFRSLEQQRGFGWSEAMCKSFVKLVRRLPPGNEVRLANKLLRVIERHPAFPFRGGEAVCEAMASRLSRDEANNLAGAIAAAVMHNKGTEELLALADYFVAVVARADKARATELAHTLRRAIEHVGDGERGSHRLLALAKCLASLAQCLGSAEAAHLTRILIQAVARDREEGHALINQLLQSLQTLLARVKDRDAADVARALCQAIEQGAFVKQRDFFLVRSCLEVLAPRIQEPEATALVRTLFQAIERTGGYEPGPEPGECLKVLAERRNDASIVSALGLLATGYDPGLVGWAARVVVDTFPPHCELNHLMTRACYRHWIACLQPGPEQTISSLEEKALRLISCGKVVESLLQRPECQPTFQEAAELTRSHLLRLCAQTSSLSELDRGRLALLTYSLEVLANHLSEGEAAELARVLIATIGRTKEYDVRRDLGKCLAALAWRLQTAETAELARVLIAAIGRAQDDEARELLGKCLETLAGQLQNVEAPDLARILFRSIERAGSPYQASVYVTALKRLVKKLEGAQAAEFARGFLRLIEQNPKYHNPSCLGDALRAVAVRLTDEQVNTTLVPAIEQLLRTAHNRGTSAQEEEALATLGAVADRLPAPAIEKAVSLLFEGVASAHGKETRESMVWGLRRLTGRLDLGTTVRLLKHPLCVGAARPIMTDRVGQFAGRSFTSRWEVVDWLERHHPQIDLTAPPARISP